MAICLIFGALFTNCKKDTITQAKPTSLEEDKKEVNKQKTNLIITPDNFRDFIEDIKSNMSLNETFLNDFLMSSKNGNLTKHQKNKMLDILNIKHTNVSELEKYNQKNNIYEKIDNLAFFKANSETYCQKLVRIRNVMLQECDKYPFGLSDYCSAAVMLAYWWQSRNC